jgi:geranylgeranyl diphosphate synthase type I
MTLPDLVTRHQEAVEAALQATVQGRQDPLYRMMEYQMGWVDEGGAALTPSLTRAYPALCLGVCEALGGDATTAMSAATAVELLYQFTRVHDDIQDGTPDNGPRPSVWWVWGPAQAINAGDALHVLARLSLFSMGSQGVSTEQVLAATKVMDAASLDLFEGQHQDLQIQNQVTVTQQAYLAMAERRTGSLMGCAAQLGALISGADEAVQERCKEAGRKLGLALHLQHDINEFWGATSTGGPVTIVRKSFPVVYAIETAPVAVKREIGTLFTTRVLDPKDMPRLADLLDGAGARQHSIEATQAAQAEFLSTLEGAGVKPGPLAEFEAFATYFIQNGLTGA